MHSRTKAILITLAVAVMLATAASAASANTLSISDDEIEIFFDDLTLESSLGNVICDVTLLGTFHNQTITKEVAQLIGHISHASVDDAGCTDTVLIFAPDGEAPAEALPWHISFDGWAGTLPNIREIYLILRGLGFNITGLPILNGTCPYVVNAQVIAYPEASRTDLEFNESIDYSSTKPEDCPEVSFASGRRPILDLNGVQDVHVTLV